MKTTPDYIDFLVKAGFVVGVGKWDKTVFGSYGQGSYPTFQAEVYSDKYLKTATGSTARSAVLSAFKEVIKELEEK